VLATCPLVWTVVRATWPVVLTGPFCANAGSAKATPKTAAREKIRVMITGPS
jgi:hypothetical protein